MAHSYTPGLRVAADCLVRRERRLPLKGDVVVREGQHVDAGTVVARTELPGNVHSVNLASKLSIDPARVAAALRHAVGTAVRKGDTIAVAKSLFGLMRQTAEAPVDGTLETVSTVTGQLMMREPPIPVEVCAFVKGVVAHVMPHEGVVVEARAAFLQGIFGVGGETFGRIEIASSGPDRRLEPGDVKPEHRGAVVVGGSHVSHAALMRAREVGAVAVVAGGFDDRDLRLLLGRDLGVAITGAEELGLTLVLTEGFGAIRMAERTWKLLASHRGHAASVSGATQIRAGVMRPEILVPLEGFAGNPTADDHAGGLEIGSLLRVIREPYFGRIGKVVELPPELRALESEAEVRVLVVQFADDDTRAVIPRANVELISR